MQNPEIFFARLSPSGLVPMILSAALFTGSAEAQTTLGGDYRIGPGDGTTTHGPGDLDADGDLGFGRTDGSPSLVAGKLRYFPIGNILAFDASLPSGQFTWNDTVDDEENERIKMLLDLNNVLSLYKTDGSSASITLSPDTGAIKLSGGGAGIFNSTGGGVLQIDGMGRPYFSTKPIFQDGIDFGGTAGTLDGSKVEFLQSMLSDFGYDPAAGSYTDATTLVTDPRIAINKMVVANGSVYWIGNFSGYGVEIGQNAYSSNLGKTVVVKASPDGSVAWVKQISGSALTGLSMAVNSSGTLVIGGVFTGATSNLGAHNMTATGGYDGFVLVMNSSGTLQWSKVIAASGYDTVLGVAIDGSGNVAAVGEFRTAASINLGTGSLPSAGGDSDGFLVKYSNTGTPQWSAPIGGAGADAAKAVEFAPSGNVLVAGSGRTTTNLGVHNVTVSGSETDGWLSSWSSTGSIQWAKGVGGTGRDSVVSVKVDSSGNSVVLGSFTGTTTTLGSHNKSSVGGDDGLVVSFDSNGTVNWARAIGSSGAEWMSEVVLDSSGTIVVAGNVGGSTTTLGTYDLVGKGSMDGCIVMLDSSGTPVGSEIIGGADYDSLFSAQPLGDVADGLVVKGAAGTALSLGDARFPAGNFLVSVAQGSISTPPAALPSSLAWNGGVASPAGGIAMGGGAVASGQGSTAFSGGAAVGDHSFAAGTGTAHGVGSNAFGEGTIAVGPYSTAFGRYANALGDGSFATGLYTSAAGYASVAMGDTAMANGDYSYAVGWLSGANGYGAIAMGESAYAYGDNSVALGAYTSAHGTYSMALGVGTSSNSLSSFALGAINIGGGNPNEWIETDPLFEVGNGWTGNSNALTMLKNGRTTLTNKAWLTAVNLDDDKALEDPNPASSDDSGGTALIVEGHTELRGKVIISKPQGDIPMFTGN